MLAIIHLQDQRYCYLCSIIIRTETKHYTCKPEFWPDVRQQHQCQLLQRRNESAVSILTQHSSNTHIRRRMFLRTSFCLFCSCVSWANTWLRAFFRLKVLTCCIWASTYGHGHYFGMGDIMGEYSWPSRCIFSLYAYLMHKNLLQIDPYALLPQQIGCSH